MARQHLGQSAAETGPRLLKVFQGQTLAPPPIWLMRQAGRYLPEYRRVREQAGGFLNLCYTPELATEVTLQPIERFDLDAAILFSDILVLPNALGQKVWFAEGEGPRLEPIANADGISLLDIGKSAPIFDKVCAAVRSIRAVLPPEKALIGFCGAPWTVATYVVAGRGSPDQAAARQWAYTDRTGFTRLIDLITNASVDYLSAQIEAGVDLVQIFDSWSGSLPDDEFDRWVVSPTKKIVHEIKRRHPDTPIIGFPRAAGMNIVRYCDQTAVDGIGCDTSVPLDAMAGPIAATGAVVQGNLDPLLLVAGGQPMRDRLTELCTAMAGEPFILNLGHGIVPHTPPEHVAELVAHVRNFGRPGS
jgi:uroporphyrinogen decarboxylase